MFLLSTSTILSPALNPTFSEGPPATVVVTSKVSLKILKVIPIPSKFPTSGSFISATSSFDM